MSTRRSSLRRSLRRGRRAVQPELSALSLPKLDRVFYIPNRYDATTGKFLDRDGQHSGEPQLLQYASLAAPVTLYHTSIVGTETATNQGTASVSFAAGSMTIGAGTAWNIVDSVGHVWEFCSALSSTSVVMWDVSGNGAHLVAGGLDAGVVTALCSEGREYGSNHLNMYGWTISDTSQYVGLDWLHVVSNGKPIPADKNSKYALTYSGDDNIPPTVFFNGVDFTGSTFTSTGTITSDNVGKLQPHAANLPAITGGRYTSGVWYDTTSDGTPIVSSTQQKTRVGTTANTVATGAVLGPELIAAEADRSFSSDTGWWFKQSGWDINITNPGKLTGTNPNYNSTYKSSLLIVGRRYKVSITIDAMPGVLRVGDNSTGYVDFNTTGTKLFEFTATGTTFQLTGRTATGVFIIDNISLKEIIPTPVSPFSDSTTFKRYDNSNPNLLPGWLCEPARSNKCTCVKANPTATTNISKTGDAAGVLSVVDDSAALAAAGLDKICTSGKVYKLDNSAGTTSAYANISGITTNTNAHSLSCYVRVGVGTGRIDWNTSPSVVTTTSSSYIRLLKENTTPPSTSASLSLSAIAGSVIYFILPQLEEGMYCTSPIIGTDTAALQSRAGIVLTLPTAGRIRPNNFAIRMIVIPNDTWASGYATQSLFSLYSSSTNRIYAVLYGASQIVDFIINLNGAYTEVSLPISKSKGTPIEFVFIKSNLGMRISYRQFENGWGAWQTSTFNSTTTAMLNVGISSNVSIGCQNNFDQFNGCIQLFDTLFIPEGIADPMGWAKNKWGIV